MFEKLLHNISKILLLLQFIKFFNEALVISNFEFYSFILLLLKVLVIEQVTRNL